MPIIMVRTLRCIGNKDLRWCGYRKSLLWVRLFFPFLFSLFSLFCFFLFCLFSLIFFSRKSATVLLLLFPLFFTAVAARVLLFPFFLFPWLLLFFLVYFFPSALELMSSLLLLLLVKWHSNFFSTVSYNFFNAFFWIFICLCGMGVCLHACMNMCFCSIKHFRTVRPWALNLLKPMNYRKFRTHSISFHLLWSVKL